MSEEQAPMELDETPKAAYAFQQYCAMGPARSLAKLADSYGKNTAYVRQYEKWSSLYNWQERVKQYDAERAEEKRIARERAREEAEDRHAEQAQEEQEIARGVIKKGAAKGHISMSAVQLLKNSRDDERKALGMDETVKTKVELTGKDGGPLDIVTKWNGGNKAREDKDDAES